MTKLKTLWDVRNLLTAEFNAIIADTHVQSIFAAQIPLWGDLPFLFENDDPARETACVRGVITSFADAINAEILFYQRMTASMPYTRQSKTTTEHGHTVTTTRDNNNTTTFVDGGEETATEVYPDGYVGAQDSAYLRSVDSRTALNNDVTTVKVDDTDTTKNTGTDTNTTNDFDLKSWIDALPAIKSIFVEYCVDILLTLADTVSVPEYKWKRVGVV